jgi:iron complex outermembrane receptor protein
MFNEIRVLHGGGSSLFGSGLIGGSIHLGSEPVFKPDLEVQAGLFGGSFGNIGGSAGFTFSSDKWVSNTRLVGKIAENNFPYTDLSGTEQKLKNARQNQGGILQDLYYRTNTGWTVGASVWLQENDKQIPATLTSKPSDASQNDRSLRSMASVKKQLKKGNLQFKTALITDRSHYQDPDSLESVAIDSKISSDVWISDVQFSHSLGTFIMLHGGGRYTYTEATSDSYDNLEIQNQAAIFASVLYHAPSIDWKFNLNLRQEWVDNYSVPFTPAFGAEGRIFRIVSGKISISRNFRIPTLNDRYWIPGGNPELQPETSWNQEASLIFNLHMQKMRNKTRMVFTVFNANVDQWILWIPEGNLWTAQNVQKVWARGGEIEYRSSFYLGATEIIFNGGYTYSRSTNEKTTSENDQSYRKQLIYVPEHRYFFTGRIRYKGYSFAYNQAYTGKRYTTRDNSESLPGYSLGNIYLRKILIRSRHSIDLGFAVNNIWDVDYQSVQYNPMPGRHVEINMIYKFKKSNK